MLKSLKSFVLKQSAMFIARLHSGIVGTQVIVIKGEPIFESTMEYQIINYIQPLSDPDLPLPNLLKYMAFLGLLLS